MSGGHESAGVCEGCVRGMAGVYSATVILCHSLVNTDTNGRPAAISASASPQLLATLVPLRVLARSWPGRPDGIDPSAVFRYARRGVRGVRLRAIRVPGAGWCSCQEWVLEFLQACNAPARSSSRAKPRRHLRDRLLRDRSQG